MAKVEVRSPPMKGYPDGVVYDPLPYQAEFHASPAKYRWMCGGMGAGKSLSGCMEGLMTAITYPGSYGAIIRRGWRELRTSTFSLFLSIIPKELVHGRVLESPGLMRVRLRCPGGGFSTVYGWNGDPDTLQGHSFDWWYVDEAGQFEDDALWRELCGRLRGHTGPYRGWATGYPNGHDWLYQRFVRKHYRGYHWIWGPSHSNIWLPTGFVDDLRRTNSKEWVDRYLEAKFTQFEGQVYSKYDETIHITDSMDIKPHWPRYVGIDPGMRDPTAGIYVAVDEQGVVWVMDEVYESDKTISEQVKLIRRMTEDNYSWAVIDSSAGRRSDESGVPLVDIYRSAGIRNLFEGTKNLAGTIPLVQEAFLVGLDRTNPYTGKKGFPGIQIHRRCHRLRNELLTCRYEDSGKVKPGNDHCLDALRYILARRPGRAIVKKRDEHRPSWNAFWKSLAEDIAADERLPYIN